MLMLVCEAEAGRGVQLAARGAVGVRFTGDFYGFAHGWMASQGAQFGCVTRFALAAAGIRVQDRAPVRVAAAVRWRLAVFVCKIARGSESLRTRHVGGCLPRLVGALRPLAGLLDEGATRASGSLVAARDCSASYHAVACVALCGGGVACGRRGSGSLAASSP